MIPTALAYMVWFVAIVLAIVGFRSLAVQWYGEAVEYTAQYWVAYGLVIAVVVVVTGPF